MSLDIARNDTSECSYEVVHLTRVCAANGISDTDTVDTDLVYCLVDGKQVDQVGSERIFRRESDFNVLGLDEFDDFDGSLESGYCTAQECQPHTVRGM